MREKIGQYTHWLRSMSPLKKALTIFFILLIFAILIEGPGGGFLNQSKNARFFLPRFSPEAAEEIIITDPLAENPRVELEKTEGTWRLASNHFLLADAEKVDNFLKLLSSLTEDQLASKNPDRNSVFRVDPAQGIHVEVLNAKRRPIADFYAGKKAGSDRQYLRKADESRVIAARSLDSYLSQTQDDWREKTLMNIEEKSAKRLTLNNLGQELTLEKKQNVWRVVEPEDYEADIFAIRTLFEQLKTVRADGFASASEGSQVNFESPDYKLSVRLADDSLKFIWFKASGAEGNFYYTKNGENDIIYKVSPALIDNIFGLTFKPHVEL